MGFSQKGDIVDWGDTVSLSAAACCCASGDGALPLVVCSLSFAGLVFCCSSLVSRVAYIFFCVFLMLLVVTELMEGNLSQGGLIPGRASFDDEDPRFTEEGGEGHNDANKGKKGLKWTDKMVRLSSSLH
ncbi:hypothetical protein Dsin_022916 [Dipteronia sinensis]|uniref:Uncharacterized protein n=1 Tax=Dipteronia sinensis TaxID=43782 RepID=A0AAE0A3S6_9ROSI|nr:hypothetical protein Dsin_022916 [Dipteronia sinensis]